MKPRELKLLVSWLEQADIQVLELQEQDASVRIVMQSARQPRKLQENKDPGSISPDKDAPHAIVAAEPGIFLLAHPCSARSFVSKDSVVVPGDLLGLLKIDDILYKPVVADQKGRVNRLVGVDGQWVDVGMTLFELESDKY